LTEGLGRGNFIVHARALPVGTRAVGVAGCLV